MRKKFFACVGTLQAERCGLASEAHRLALRSPLKLYWILRLRRDAPPLRMTRCQLNNAEGRAGAGGGILPPLKTGHFYSLFQSIDDNCTFVYFS